MERRPEMYRVLLQEIKINLKKLLHLVGFTIEIYHDARPYKCQIWRELGKIEWLMVIFSYPEKY
jgi:hypothetical protein